MSVVDTWDWDKLDTSTYNEPIKMTADMKVQTALYDFENNFGVRPNTIVMGYHFLDEVVDIFYDKNFRMKTLEEVAKEQNLGVYCKYEGIPIKIDYNNPDTLKVGCMMDWTGKKY